jgi:hypothetical protein
MYYMASLIRNIQNRKIHREKADYLLAGAIERKMTA